MNLNWIDIVVLVILGLTVIRSFLRGMIRSIFDIIALGVSIWLGFIWYRDVSLYLTSYIKLPGNLVYTISFLLVFIGVYLITSLIGYLLHRLIGRGFLGPVNSLAGGAIGFAKGIIIVWIALQIIIIFPLPPNISTPLKTSQTLNILKPALEFTAQTVFRIMPKDIPTFNDFFKDDKPGKKKVIIEGKERIKH
ncbi:MAG: CvpA family protein [Candidatus Saganbacteria bacterium]|nr:CvpA family protein [Candidatus Saganbacteria bacterium]